MRPKRRLGSNISRGVALAALLVLSAVALAGCAGATFKRGASPGSIAADERACREKTATEKEYADCMRERGYVTSSGVDFEPTQR
ncbi:MAG: hypothetical protein VX246_00920 [Myxococcota bacterium]|nr:hypothetical protein [Myxococcota bacterium]